MRITEGASLLLSFLILRKDKKEDQASSFFCITARAFTRSFSSYLTYTHP